jgi:hypothetical protein
MKFRMKIVHAITQAALEQRILIFCEIVKSDMFLHAFTLERWERSHTQLTERH